MPDLAIIGPHGREPRPRPLLRTTLGGVLRRSRLDQGRTLAEVAGDAKVSVPYLSEVERGRKEVSSEVLAAVCDALRIDLADVVTEVGRDLAQAGLAHRDLAHRDLAQGQFAQGQFAQGQFAQGRTYRAPATPLGAARPRHAPARGFGSGDVVCLAA
jgi:transcriptional regulator with XRE-family HTH domain